MRQKNGFDRFPEFKSKGIEFKVGGKCMFRQLTDLLIYQSVRLVHQDPLRDIMEKDKLKDQVKDFKI
jgi:hypothetical protein